MCVASLAPCPPAVGYAKRGLDVLVDTPRPGRPSTVDEATVVVTTLNPPPDELGVTHWSSRLLSAHLTKAGTPVSFAEIVRIWRDWNLQPHRVETFQVLHRPAVGGQGPRRGQPVTEPAR